MNFNGDSMAGASVAITATALDSAGNRYVAGYFDGITTQMGGVTLSRIGGTDGFVAKIDAAGNVVWARNYGGTSTVNALMYGIAVDGGGNIHVAGYFNNGDMTSPAMTKIGSVDLFALKLNAAGDVIWAKNFGGDAASAYAVGLALDVTGNVYLSGRLKNGNLTTPVLTMVGGTGPLITNGIALKLDADGNVLWSRAFGGAGAEVTLAGLAVDSGGNAYLSGNFGQASLTSPLVTAIGNQTGATFFRDGLVFKLDANGDVAWARNYGGAWASVSLGGLAVDASGNVFAAGSFNNANLTTPALTKNGNTDALLIKLNASTGNLVAASNIGRAGVGLGFAALALDGLGNLIAGGTLTTASLTSPALTRIGNRDAVAFKFDSAGNVVWARNFGGAGATVGVLAVGSDGAGNSYLNGTFNSGSLTTPSLTKRGQMDAYDIKLDAAGVLLAATAYNTGRRDSNTRLHASARDNAGNLYIAGDFQHGTLTLGGIVLPPHSSSGIDAYVAKISSAGTVLWARNYGGSGSTTASFSGIAVDGGGNIYLSGSFQQGALESPVLPLIGSTDGLVMKLDAAGNTAWARSHGGMGAQFTLNAIALAADGSPYLAGNLSSGNSIVPALTRVGTADAIAMKLDAATGNAVWARNYGGASVTAQFRKIVVDGNGNAYIGGDFTGGGIATAPALGLVGLRDGMVFRIDAAGNVAWSKAYGSMGATVFIQGLALDGGGNVLIGGSFDTTGHAYKLDGAGNVLWTRRFGSGNGGTVGILDVAASGGSYYAVGRLGGGDLTTPALTRIGRSDSFLVRMDGSGNPVWAKNYGGRDASVTPATVVADGNLNAYLGGTFTSAALTTPALPLLGSTDGLSQRVTAAYTVTAQADAHSSVSPASGLAVSGLPATFTVTPAAGYNASVSGCGINLAGIATATTVSTGAISGDCNLGISSTLVVACGSAAGSASSYAPAANLCAVGTAGGVQSGSPWSWSWSCTGGGATVACSAPNASLPSGNSNGRIEVAGGGWSINVSNSAGFIPPTGHAKSPPGLPPGYNFPYDLVDLELTGGVGPAIVTLTYSNTLPANAVYWKYGPEPGNVTPHWYIFPNAVITGNTVTLTLHDGQQGDADLMVNGVIRDPGGPGAPIGVLAIPTLSEWAMAILACLLAWAAAAAMGRCQKRVDRHP